MKKNMFETIAAIIMEDMQDRSNTPITTMKDVPRTVRLQACRHIAGITATVHAYNESYGLYSEEDFHPIIANEFLQNRESFETLMDFLTRDEEINGEFAHIIGTFVLEIFIPIMCELEELTAEEEIEIISQVFLLIHMLCEEDILHPVLDACFSMFEEEDIHACDVMSARLVELKEQQQEHKPIQGTQEQIMKHYYEDHKEFIVDAIVQYGRDAIGMSEATTVQKFALYIVSYAEDVELIKDRNLSEFNISHPLGMYFTDNHEEIHALCEDILEFPNENGQAARTIIHHVNNYLKEQGTLPTMESKKDYVKHIYEMFHMLRITCIIREREDILIGLKGLFTQEEKEQFSSYISFLNIITLIDIKVE